MKKILLISVLILLLSSYTFAIEDNFPVQKDENIEQPILLETEESALDNDDTKFSPYSKESLKGILTKEYELDSIDGMFKEQQTFRYKKGPFQETYTQINAITSLTEEIPQKGKSSFEHEINSLNLKKHGLQNH